MGRAEATRQQADAVFDAIPLGRPMTPGHHSYKADRNRRERAWSNLSKSFEQAAYADELARQADTAGQHMGARYNPETVGNRIQTLETERRPVQRLLDASSTPDTDVHYQPAEQPAAKEGQDDYTERLRTQAIDLDEQIAYWTDIYAQLQADGQATTLSPDTVATGDFVKVHCDWYRVRRVNKKSVTVPSHLVGAPQPGHREWTDTVAWHKITDHKRPDAAGRVRGRLRTTRHGSAAAAGNQPSTVTTVAPTHGQTAASLAAPHGDAR